MKNHATGRRHARTGFSLVELLVTVSVAGTLASLAAPSFTRLLQDGRRAATVNELLSTMREARWQAASLGQAVVVCGFTDVNHNGVLDATERSCSGPDWSDGWFVAIWTDLDHDGRVEPVELAAPLRVQVNDAPGTSVRAAGFANAPRPSGTAVLRPFDRFSSNGTVTVCDRRGAAEARALVLAATGRAHLASVAADGRALACP